MEATRHDPLKAKVIREWDAANPPTRAYQPLSYVVPSQDTPKREKWPRSLRQWEVRLFRHHAKYERFMRIHGWRIPADDLRRTDIRYWEARICGIDTEDFGQWFWFCGLHQLVIADLCFYSRACNKDVKTQRRLSKKKDISGHPRWQV
jgi:hypothetical protein